MMLPVIYASFVVMENSQNAGWLQEYCAVTSAYVTDNGVADGIDCFITDDIYSSLQMDGELLRCASNESSNAKMTNFEMFFGVD